MTSNSLPPRSYLIFGKIHYISYDMVFFSFTNRQRINRWPMDSPHQGPAMPQVFPCHDVIIQNYIMTSNSLPPGHISYLVKSIIYLMICFFSFTNRQRINRWPMDSPHQGPAMPQVFPCHDVIIQNYIMTSNSLPPGHISYLVKFIIYLMICFFFVYKSAKNKRHDKISSEFITPLLTRSARHH